MELPGQIPRRDSGGHRQSLLHRPFGRPGPVVVDITKDAQCATAPFRYERITSIRSYAPALTPDARRIEEAARLIDEARRPLAMIGQGAILGNAEAELRAFLDRSGMPAASTLLGLSALPSDDPRNVGMLGMHGKLRPQHQKQGVRPARRRRNAFRRPRNGRPRRLRPQRPDHPFGDRPLRNRQDRPCRRAPRGRRQAHAPAADRTHPPARPQRMDRGVPRLRPHRVRALWCGGRSVPTEGASAWARRSTPWHAPTTATR